MTTKSSLNPIILRSHGCPFMTPFSSGAHSLEFINHYLPLPCHFTHIESTKEKWGFQHLMLTLKKFLAKQRCWNYHPANPGTTPLNFYQILFPCLSPCAPKDQSNEKKIRSLFPRLYLPINISQSCRWLLCWKKMADSDCIDYRGLTMVTVKYHYPSLLIPSSTEQARGAKFFTKLELSKCI